ncbi:hypothetical protein BIV57_03625 [Mangrovactinospora gilvigrisea]|uniref:DUF3533 domain-containing protein n=1 Tax=Mangrovactinospora gilvigrisea TaxID=1428644 RepID=A0A1J7CBE4_9ACTN|nr:carboxypeptidase regulatory-like domain-containing protein [Mangrovactinospora gilvigrisea]OIV38840.1 hypothetical protein BIV57_03625 [Mangrovactinospora gilvigrisea]
MAALASAPAAPAAPAPARVRTLAEALWLPALFLAGFVFSYLVAFHHPVPHHVRVAVAAPAAAAGRMQHGLDAALPGGFDLRPAAGPAAARHAVLDHEVPAAVAVHGRDLVLYGAKADGAALETVLQQAFTGVARHGGGQLRFTELVPTAPGDGIGNAAFYLVLACTLPCYFAVVGLQRAVGFGLGRRLAAYAGVAAVTAAICWFFPVYGLDALPRQPLALVCLFLLCMAVSLTSQALVPFLGRFFPGAAVLVFMILGMPASGGVVPVPLVPGLFRALHPVLPQGNAVDALRSVDYFDRTGLLRPVLVLLAWIAAALLLLPVGAALQRRRLARSVAAADGVPVPEPPVEDPDIELPRPTALPTGRRPPVAHHHPSKEALRAFFSDFGAPEPELGGVVTDGRGHPLPDTVITVTSAQGRALVRTRTAADGRYAVAGLPDGPLLVLARAEGRHPVVHRASLRAAAGPLRQDFALDAELVGAAGAPDGAGTATAPASRGV